MKAILLLFAIIFSQSLILSKLNAPFFASIEDINRFASKKKLIKTLPNDPRKVRSRSSPKWLEAVGKMTSRISTTEQEQCSLTLINDRPQKDGIIGITAGHCVDHWYIDLGKFDIGHNVITFTSNSGKIIKRSIIEVLVTEMDSSVDYAIVKLDSSIARADLKPLLHSPYHYSDLIHEDDFNEQFTSYATMVGFSADQGIGQKGRVMTYDEKCQLQGGARGLKKAYCHAYGGASGGAVVVTVALNEDTGDIYDDLQLAGTTQHFFVGSIVGGRVGDNSSKTMFTENTYYYSRLIKILAAH